MATSELIKDLATQLRERLATLDQQLAGPLAERKELSDALARLTGTGDSEPTTPTNAKRRSTGGTERILSTLRDAQQPMKAAEIGRAAGVENGVHTLLAGLVKRGAVEKDDATKTYRIAA